MIFTVKFKHHRKSKLFSIEETIGQRKEKDLEIKEKNMHRFKLKKKQNMQTIQGQLSI